MKLFRNTFVLAALSLLLAACSTGTAPVQQQSPEFLGSVTLNLGQDGLSVQEVDFLTCVGFSFSDVVIDLGEEDFVFTADYAFNTDGCEGDAPTDLGLVPLNLPSTVGDSPLFGNVPLEVADSVMFADAVDVSDIAADLNAALTLSGEVIPLAFVGGTFGLLTNESFSGGIILGVFSLPGVEPEEDDDDEEELETIAGTALATEELTVLVANLNEAQVAALSDETLELTVFAPVNSAFEDIADTLSELDAETLAAVIDYHVIAGALSFDDLVALDGDTLPGSDIEVSVAEDDEGETVIILFGAINEVGALVISGEIEAANGFVYLIDAVLLPEVEEEEELETIAAIATATDDLSTLVGSLNEAQVAALSDETAELTVFAPVNSAFEDIADTLSELDAETLAAIIDYHVIAGALSFDDLVALDEQTLPGSDIEVSVDEDDEGETVIFLFGAFNEVGVLIISDEIEAANGFVYLIDAVLLPDVEDEEEDPEPVVVTTELSGDNEVPPVETVATGSATATLVGMTLTVEGSFEGLESDLFEPGTSGSPAHVHVGAADENGPIVFNLDVETEDERSGTFSATVELDEGELEDFLAGLFYVNIHTVDNPGGELRGQFVIEDEEEEEDEGDNGLPSIGF